MIVYFGGHRQRESEQVTAMAAAIDGSQCQESWAPVELTMTVTGINQPIDVTLPPSSQVAIFPG